MNNTIAGAGPPPTTSAPAASRDRAVSESLREWTGAARNDLLALLAILAAYLVMVIAMPIAHDFAYIDDWAYARSVDKIVHGIGFQPVQVAQATLVTHAYWGALFAQLFGYSFTSLTLATMCLAFVGTAAFYVLLRRLGFGVSLSIFGAAMLALNPYYLALSYSFMTDVTFTAITVLACLFYFEGLKRESTRLLWLGGLFAALAFLTRQFGLAIPLAATIWLAYAHRLRWSNLAAVALLPAVAAVGYFAWSSSFGPTFSGSVGRDELLALLNPYTWVQRASHFIYLAAFLPGLTIPIYNRVRHWKIALVLAIIAAIGVFALWQVKSDLVQQGSSTINDLSYSWLQPFWVNPTPIYCIGAALTVWLLAGIIERATPGAISLLRKRRAPQPEDFLYLTALILFVGTFVVSAGFLDRYWLPLLPFLIAGALSGAKLFGPRWPVPSLVMMLLLAGYGAAMHLSDYAFLGADWQAARSLVAQGVPYEKIEAGYSWDGYFLYDEAVQKLGVQDIAQVGRVFPPQQIIDPEYVIGPANPSGYHVVARFPYFSWLDGQRTHELLISQRGP